MLALPDRRYMPVQTQELLNQEQDHERLADRLGGGGVHRAVATWFYAPHILQPWIDPLFSTELRHRRGVGCSLARPQLRCFLRRILGLFGAGERMETEASGSRMPQIRKAQLSRRDGLKPGQPQECEKAARRRDGDAARDAVGTRRLRRLRARGAPWQPGAIVEGAQGSANPPPHRGSLHCRRRRRRGIHGLDWGEPEGEVLKPTALGDPEQHEGTGAQPRDRSGRLRPVGCLPRH